MLQLGKQRHIKRVFSFNNFRMILDNQDRLVLNDHSVTSPHNEPHRSPGFVQKQPPELLCRKMCFAKKIRKFPKKKLVLESLFNRVAGRNFTCERLLLFVSPQTTITNSSGEFGLNETSIECKVFF